MPDEIGEVGGEADSAGAGTSVDPVERLGGLARLLPSPFSINFEERSSFEGARDGGRTCEERGCEINSSEEGSEL